MRKVEERFTLQTPTSYDCKKAIVAGMISVAAFAAIGSLAYIFSPLSLKSIGVIEGLCSGTLIPVIIAVAGFRSGEEKSMMLRGPKRTLSKDSTKPLLYS